ncbi:MAG: hypothetical protein HYX69_19340 [Planctomycetia bacterium]|nr:hypothetical protein [Planctomycetia bacterium]
MSDPKEVAKELAKKLDARDPPAPNDISENEETGEVIVDFIIWPDGFSKPEDAPYVEFDIFKYSKNEGGGLVAEQYALREYDDIKGFLGGLKPVRKRLIDLMATEGLVSDTAQDARQQQGEQPTATGDDAPEESAPESNEMPE